PVSTGGLILGYSPVTHPHVRFDPGDATTAYAAMGTPGLYRLSFAADGTFQAATKVLDPPAGGGGAIRCVAMDRHGRVFAAAGDNTGAGEFVNMSVNRGVSWTNLKTDMPGIADALGVLETVTYPSGEEHLLIGTQGTGAFRRRLPPPGGIITIKNGTTTLNHSQSTLDFGTGGLMPGSSVTLTIFNRGTIPLTSLNLRVTGINAAEFLVNQPISTTVPPGGSTTCTVTFSPVDHGVRAAALHIASSATDQSSFDINLTGPGQTLLETWRQTYFGTTNNAGNAADLFDYDHDGLVNLIEYAFGLNPTLADSSQLPAGQMIGSNFVISFTQPSRVGGITYVAKCRTSLTSVSWVAVPDTGTPPQHIFSVPIGTNTQLFMRLGVTAP
ncbi:MAG: choice-of-anchor D domain-containing protein, partial [Verrucomicrobiota bacterium]